MRRTNQCNFSDIRNDKLKTHMKVHEKERIKSFLCDQCDFRTVEKRTLKFKFMKKLIVVNTRFKI